MMCIPALLSAPIVEDSNRQQYGYVHHSLFYITYCIFRRIYIIQQL